MRWSFCLACTALAFAACRAETARAQGTYSGKVVYGMFGPRVLGESLQSPVQRPDRGIARDAYGSFVGVNQAYSGLRFGPPKPRVSTAEPAAVPAPVQPTPPSVPEQAPEPQPGPDEWLRSPGSADNVTPSPSAGTLLPDSSWLPGPRSSPPRPGFSASVVGFAGGRPASDPFARRLATILDRTVQIQRLSPIRVEVNGETAILRGRVATTRDRELAENLIRLEPGVWEVKNELIVEAATRVAATAAPSVAER